jgi:transposase
MIASEKDQVVGMLRGGCTTYKVADQFQRSERTIRNLQKKYNLAVVDLRYYHTSRR